MTVVRSVIQAIVVRCVLLLHSLLSVWRAVVVTGEVNLWYLLLTNLLLVTESIYCVVIRKGQERKWFCPCFLFYLFNTIPSLWLIELDRLNNYGMTVTNQNVSSTGDISINGLTIPVQLDSDAWASALEQSQLFLLIIGRWGLPRGKLSRDQLSQLLFMYLGCASDVMELFILFEEPEVRLDLKLSYTILIVWSMSLIVFTLVISATRKPRSVITDPAGTAKAEQTIKDRDWSKLFQTEVWSILVTILLLDGPYMIIRLYTIITYGIFRYGILFFTCKNILIVSLLLYRLIVVCLNKQDTTENTSSSRNKVTHEKHALPENSDLPVFDTTLTEKHKGGIKQISSNGNDVEMINLEH